MEWGMGIGDRLSLCAIGQGVWGVGCRVWGMVRELVEPLEH